ncbi:MAG: transposase, partial [Selenomonadaceae bacterium]|nr:transposase [Selenomonadaceae bacterium]
MKKQREEWIKFIQSVNPEKLVFLDESGVNTDFTRNYGRSIGKSRIVANIPRNTPKNTTVVSSIRLNGERAYQSVDGSMNTEKFKNYIENILCPTLKFGDIVVMDNLSVHKNKEIEKIINRV